MKTAISASGNLQRILSIFFALFLGLFLAFNTNLSGGKNGYFPVIFLIYCLVATLYFFIIGYLRKRRENCIICAVLFLSAAIPRLLVVMIGIYKPYSDFLSYLQLGQYFFNKDYSSIAAFIADSYHMPKMAGIAIYNGLLSYIFSPTLIGLQISNIMTTSSISVMIYVLYVKYNKNVALIAAALFAVYPSNIVSTAVTTNQHGATLMFLVALYFFQRSLNEQKFRGYLCIAVSAVFFTISNFIHQSVIIVLCG